MMRNIFTIFTAVSVCCLGFAVLWWLPPELRIAFGKRPQPARILAEPSAEFSEFYPDRRQSVDSSGRMAGVQEVESGRRDRSEPAQKMRQLALNQMESVTTAADGPEQSLLSEEPPEQAREPIARDTAEDFQGGPALNTEISAAKSLWKQKESVTEKPVSGTSGSMVASHAGVSGSGNVTEGEQTFQDAEDRAAMSEPLPPVAVMEKTRGRSKSGENGVRGAFVPSDVIQQEERSGMVKANSVSSAAVAAKAESGGSPQPELESATNGENGFLVDADVSRELPVVAESMAEQDSAAVTSTEFSNSEPAIVSERVGDSDAVVAESMERSSDSESEFGGFAEEADEEDLFAIELKESGSGTALPEVASFTGSLAATTEEQVVQEPLKQVPLKQVPLKQVPLKQVPVKATQSASASAQTDSRVGSALKGNLDGVSESGDREDKGDFGSNLADTGASAVVDVKKDVVGTLAAATVRAKPESVEAGTDEAGTDSENVEILFDVSELAATRRGSHSESSPPASVIQGALESAGDNLPTLEIPQRVTVKGPQRMLVPELEFEEWVNHGVPREVPVHGGTLVRPFTPQPPSPSRRAVTRVRGSVEEVFERIPRLFSFRSERRSEKGFEKSSPAKSLSVESRPFLPGEKSASHLQPRPATGANPLSFGGGKIPPPGGIVRAGWSTDDEQTIAAPRKISPAAAAAGTQTQKQRLSPR